VADLETILLKLARHGEPRLSLHDSGWHCAVDMHVAAVGAKFSVSTDFKQATPLNAAEQCAERIEAMLCGFSSRNEKAITHG
jgi:hypothetical protein